VITTLKVDARDNFRLSKRAKNNQAGIFYRGQMSSVKKIKNAEITLDPKPSVFRDDIKLS